ncbi:MAG: GLUG motif-containing protein [Planctomycetota bacterium]
MTGIRISKLLRQINIPLIICFCSLSAQAKYGGGSGTQEDPYQIWDANHMQAIGTDSNDWDEHFKLRADIDLSYYDGNDGRPKFNMIGEYVGYNDPDNKPFTGFFDGNNHTISNFTHESNNKDYIGVFGYVGIGGEIKDVGMIDADVDSGNGDYVGSLVGYLDDGAIINCSIEGAYITGDKYIGAMVGRNSGEPLSGTGRIVNCQGTGFVNGNYMTGGLVGGISLGLLSDCNSAVTVVGNEYTGGLVGWSSSLTTIRNCFATGTVDGNSSTGGLLGSASGAFVSNCYATGDVSGIDYTGGLIGDCEFQVSASNCYATGAVNGTNYTGGLVGIGEGFSNCYATGDVNGFNNTGGFAGSGGYIWNSYASGNVNGDSNTGGLLGNVSMTISNCYAAGAVSGNVNIGGLVGYDHPHFITSYTKCFWDNGVNPYLDGIGNIIDPPDVIGESTENMQTESTFTDAGWDFINVWNIGENQTYPYLRTYLAGDINRDGIVNFKDFAFVALQWLEECNFGNCPPRVLITYPEDGARLMVGGVPPQTTIWAEASDYDGSVMRVEFFVDDLKLGEDTDGSDGWNYLWQNYSLGFHVLTATAWDNDGLSVMSTPVNVEVWMPDPPPP